ncbi:SGNH/GDSL hydrolase family protein [Puniceicoccus vermicola]|uniref:SGNH/GDSL hydrolase family protein n=1 Tax=Puniceicoccus vermicola TaxID=388746 RepID=A0A7X1E714_9BACT|nr:SGNH/GDSL hydrolase family protein [Puniceicoccus vermicola]MBC2603217.1 SGNH/GDSL hydrolase family protein [Puniceicoccus vermicola]
MKKILFQGDSITHAHRRPEEVNPAFQLGGGFAFLVAARLSRDYSDNGWEFINQGECGHGVRDLVSRWEADALAHAPDVLSLLVGINDTVKAMRGHKGVDDVEFASAYRQLLEGFSSPPVSFLLEPFLLETGDVTSEWRSHIRPRQEAIRQIAEESGQVFVPLQERFDEVARTTPAERWLVDGFHPTHTGFQLIADAWLEAFSGRFPMLSALSEEADVVAR